MLKLAKKGFYLNDFDKIIDRSTTNTEKYSHFDHIEDVIPAWVADMDFLAPKEVILALEERVQHGIFGYTQVSKELENATCEFVKRHYNWEINPTWIVWTSGVVPSMNIVCGMLEKAQSVITNTPIYPYFVKAPKNMKKEVMTVPMIEKENRWTIDFEKFENSISSTCKLFLLCNPFNPGGTVFSKIELEKLASIAKKHNLIICSDEIHADLILTPNVKHTPIASLNKDILNRTITLLAPSKTFNIAGLQCSYAIIPNSELRKRFQRSMGHLNGGVNLLGYTATHAAYTKGDKWLKDLREYLLKNLKLVQEFVSKHPNLKLLDQDATFLAWIDCKALHVKSPYEFFLNHGVALSDGKGFGNENFVRLNFGCPRSVLKEILKRMDKALHVNKS